MRTLAKLVLFLTLVVLLFPFILTALALGITLVVAALIIFVLFRRSDEQ